MKNHKWAIVIVNVDQTYPTDLKYVRGYSNTVACYTYCMDAESALRFDTRDEALEWGNRYLVGHNWHFTSVPDKE